MALPMQRCCSRLRSLILPWPVAAYHAKPRKLGLSGIYKPDPEDPNTKPWHKGPEYEAKLYGRYGAASGVTPEKLWPSPEQLRALQDEERETCPSLADMLERVEAREMEMLRKKQERERLIAANMAKMPKMVEDWRRGKREARLKERAEKAQKQRLLTMAREKFGASIDPRSAKFQEMVKEMEKEEKRKLKAVKKLQREEERAAIAAVLNSAATAKPQSPPDNPA
ncbi:large ribosomal subunit protein mL64 [Gastrophryne carolinensis]